MKTALFDMDGTLLDTERIYQKYWKMASDELGFGLTEEDLLKFRSLSVKYGIALAEEMTGRKTAYEELRNRRKELMDPIMKDIEMPLKPFVAEALKVLKENGVRLGVATATRLDRTMDYLERAGLVSYFDEIISARSVENGKPAPDVYLYACERIGSKPCDTFAVEDAPNGVKSAYRAGCKVIMIPDLTEPDDEIEGMISKVSKNLMDAAEFILG